MDGEEGATGRPHPVPPQPALCLHAAHRQDRQSFRGKTRTPSPIVKVLIEIVPMAPSIGLLGNCC